MPPDSSRGYFVSKPPRPVSSSRSPAGLRYWRGSSPSISTENSTLSSTERQGSSTGCWKTKPTSGNGSCTGWSRMRMRAAGGRHEAGDQLEQGALAAAARPHQRDELVLADLERDVVDGRHEVASPRPIGLLDVVEADHARPRRYFRLGQQVVRVELLDRHLALELQVLRVGVARLLQPRRLELAHRHLAGGDLFGVDEAGGDLGRPQRALGVDFGMVLDAGSPRPRRSACRGTRSRRLSAWRAGTP